MRGGAAGVKSPFLFKPGSFLRTNPLPFILRGEALRPLGRIAIQIAVLRRSILRRLTGGTADRGVRNGFARLQVL